MASEWSTNKRLKKDQEKLLFGLKVELSSNLEYISDRKVEIYEFAIRINQLVKENGQNPSFFIVPFKEKPFAARIPGFPGLGKSALNRAMFEAAIYSNLFPDLNIELIKQLSVSYSIQHNFLDSRAKIERKLEYIDSETTYREVMDIMYEYLDEFYKTHERLESEYQKTIELIENSLN
ncbi:hypothetical protein [Polaribacter sp. KT25b]|uniref:hypothetical protein n=1 Tax=Polaribacter sp. KT25b TaxID=1855336 RepID=UPI000B88A62F|nr:hypothetical protein [Polaribacter sp. KT25b]